jgi:AAA15 family ATPase/GTPase
VSHGLLLVDEAKASIHWSRFPQMAKALLELLHEFNVQALFTTHSLELIDAFVDATPEKDDVALYRLTRAPDDGRTVVSAIPEADVKTMRQEFGMEVR